MNGSFNKSNHYKKLKKITTAKFMLTYEYCLLSDVLNAKVLNLF